MSEFGWRDAASAEGAAKEAFPVKSVSIANLLNMREAVCERVVLAHALLREADSIAQSAHLGPLSEALDSWRGMSKLRFLDEGGAAEVVRVLDAKGWDYLMRESGLRTFLDQQARARWDKKILEHDTPSLTAENIESTFAALYESRREMFERGVCNVFRALSWDYKTNNPMLFGKHLVIEGVMRLYGKNFRVLDSSRLDLIDDLDRVLHVQDGQPEPDHRCALSSRIRQAEERGIDRVSGPYMAVRWFRKGTAHITFLRADLVEQLNAILAKRYPNALPGLRMHNRRAAKRRRSRRQGSGAASPTQLGSCCY